MTRYLSFCVFTVALFTVALAFPVEDVGKVPDVPEPVVVVEPEVHEPVPAQPEVLVVEPVVEPELPQVEPAKEVLLPIEEAPKPIIPLDFQGFDVDKSGYIDAAEWELKADADKKDKFDQVDIDDDARISSDEFKNIPVPAIEPQENVNDVYVPAEVSDQQAVDKPVDLPVDDVAVPVGRSAEAEVVVAPVDAVVVPEVVKDIKPEEPIPAASGEQAVAVVDEAVEPKPIIEDAVLSVEEAKPTIVEERASSEVSSEDVDEPVLEQKDPVMSDEVKSEEVKSDEEVKSEEVKSEEVKEAPKPADLKSEPVVQPEVPKEVVKEPEVPKDVIKEAEIQKEPVIEEDKVKEAVKEDVKEVAKDEVKEVKEEVKPEVTKVEEPVKVEDVVQPEAVKKPEDLSPSNQIRV